MARAEQKNLEPPYALHELAYQQIKAAGGLHWADRQSNPDDHPLDPPLLRFFDNLFEEDFIPRTGEILELGCGSAVLLRWLYERQGRGMSFTGGAGIDVSPTAIELARAQSRAHSFDLQVHDHVASLAFARERFSLVVDSHCLHCVTKAANRQRFLTNAAALLAPGGVFAVATMCTPMHWQALKAQHPKSIIRHRTQYSPYAKGADYEDAIVIDGQPYVPQRYFEHWQSLLRQLRATKLAIRLVEYRPPVSGTDICGTLHVAAHKITKRRHFRQ